MNSIYNLCVMPTDFMYRAIQRNFVGSVGKIEQRTFQRLQRLGPVNLNRIRNVEPFAGET